MLAKIYINLIDQKEPKLNFLNTDDLHEEVYNSNVNYFKKVVLPSKDEIKKHKDYLNKHLKKNYFN